MSKINKNPRKSIRDHEIEKALREIYASSEDESSEEEDILPSTFLTHPYPTYDINRALDTLQNVTDEDLLQVLEDSSPTVQPASPAVIVEDLPSAVINHPSQPVAVALPTRSPAVIIETLPSAAIHQPSQVTPPTAKKRRFSTPKPLSSTISHHSSQPVAAPSPTRPLAVIVKTLPSAVIHQPSQVTPPTAKKRRLSTPKPLSSTISHHSSQPVAAPSPTRPPAVIVETLPSAVIHQPSQVTPPTAKKRRLSTPKPLSSTISHHSSQPVAAPSPTRPPAVIVETLPSAVIHQPSQVTPPTAKKRRLSTPKPLSSTISHHSSQPVAAPSPTRPPAVIVETLPSAVIHQPSQVTPPTAKKRRLSTPQPLSSTISHHSSRPAATALRTRHPGVREEATKQLLSLSAAIQPSPLLAASQPLPSSTTHHASSSAAIQQSSPPLADHQPSTSVSAQQSSSLSAAIQPSSLLAAAQPLPSSTNASSLAAIQQSSPPLADHQPSTSVSAQQSSSLSAAIQPSSLLAAAQPLPSSTNASSLAAIQQSSPPLADHQPSTSVSAQQSSSLSAAIQPSSLLAAAQPLPSSTNASSLAAIQQSSPPLADHQPSTSVSAQQSSSLSAAIQPSSLLAASQPLPSSITHHAPSSAAIQQSSHASLQDVITKVRNWSEDTTGFAAPNFTKKMESTKSYDDRSLPLDYFLDMFPDEIFGIIAAHTNSYASFMHSLNWTPTNSSEIKSYLGMVIMMGIHPLPDLELYWSSDPFYHNPVISAVMSCKRFKKLTENLHLNDRATEVPRTDPGYDKLCKIRPVMDILNKSFQENCKGSDTQSVDESMVKFKGRSSMKQYMPQKPIKRGYKVWARCDSETGYLYQFNVYTGRIESTDDGDGGLGYKVVMRLCENVEGGTLMAFDNFFTSLPLLEMLHQKNIFSVGTVRQNRKGLPPRLLPQKGDKKENKLNVGEFMMQYDAPIAVIKWRDTKDVYVCTTAFDPKSVVTIQRKQKDGRKAPLICPLAIEQYTKCMGGVDRLDHYRSSYSIGRKSTKKTWMRLFFFMLEVSCINAYIVYSRTHNKTSNSHRDFRLTLARGLIDNFTTRLRNPPLFKNKKGGQYGVSDTVRLSNVGVHMPCQSSRKRCRFCSTRVKSIRTKIMCKACQVPLCAVPCFDDFHR